MQYPLILNLPEFQISTQNQVKGMYFTIDYNGTEYRMFPRGFVCTVNNSSLTYYAKCKDGVWQSREEVPKDLMEDFDAVYQYLKVKYP